MSKKDFKNINQSIDKFFSQPTNEETESISKEVKKEELISKEPEKKINSEIHRFSLRIPMELKNYLDDESWKNRTTITNYIINLIKEDKDRKQRD